MDDKKLYRVWKKYIDRNLYRVISSEYLSDVKRFGLNPKKDPYQKIIPDIKKLFRLVLKLDRDGFIHEQDWGFKKVTGKYIVMVSLEDIDSPFIDFTPNYKETFFYKKHNGGALVQTIKKITEDIIKRKPKLTLLELNLVKRLNHWSKKKSQFNNITLFVKGSSKYFESALFQTKLGKKVKDKYWKSPFGSYEHFKDVVNKYGLSKYEPCLKGEKFFYLRLIDEMPATQIHKVV